MKKIKRFGSFALAFALMLTLFLCSSMLIYADSELSVTDTSAVTASGEDASAGDSTETEEQTDTWPVYFYASQKDTKIKVSERNYSASYEVESYITQNTEEASEETTENAEDEEYQECYVAYLAEGSYTYTATADGYYAQTCAFNVNSAGRVTPLLTACTYQKGFQIDLDTFTQSSNEGAWDGLTLDVTWFDPSETVFYISTPAQFAGLAAIVNGIYNAEITTIYDYDSNGEVVEYIPEEYAANDNAKIAAGCTTGMSASSNQVTTDDYYYSAKGYDFDGCTIYLTADLDMGGYQDEDGNWTGADYMPIGGQYQMYFYERGTGEIYVRLDNGYTLNTSRTSDGYSHVGSSFNGTLDGAGHIVYNVYCDRYSDRSYGDSASVGLIGRLGNHDSDYSTWKTKGDDGGNYPAVNPAVRNIAVDGYFHARRSTGGIVGKIGQTSASVLSDNSTGGIIENCVNFATVLNTDSKGGGGICGAAWNAGVIRNCANFGWIVKGGNHAGISGSVEIDIENCYNVGLCCQGYPYAANSFAIGVWNGGSYDLVNNYYLSTSAYWGYALSGSSDSSGFTRDLEGSIYRLTASQMKADDFITSLDGGTTNVWTKASDADAIYSFMDYDVGSMSFFPTEVSDGTDYPVPRIFTSESAPAVTQIVKTGDVEKTKYVEGQYFDASGLELWAYYEDGTKQKLYEYNDYYTYSINRALEPGDTNIDITVTVDGFSQTYTCDITVVENSIDSIEVTSQPTKLSYYAGDYFDPTGMEVQLNFTNGTCKTAVYADGIWVDSSDETTEYDIKIPLMDTPLLLGQDGSGIMVYYTYSDGVTVSAETDALSIEENIELQITSQPEDYTATAGSTAVFEVEAAGSELTYQWQYLNAGASTWRDSGMSGADTASISVPVTEARDGQQYRCVVADGDGNTVTSDAATLTVTDEAGFSITLQPSDYTGEEGSTATFTVEADGTGLTYQWQYMSAGGTIWHDSGMTGATTATLSVPITAARDGQQYRCIVTDGNGDSVISDVATLTVSDGSTLRITQQPSDYTGAVGDTATFTVEAEGNGLSYQWQYLNAGATTWRDSGMDGADTATVSVPITDARDGQQYRCVVTDEGGNMAVSDAATLSVE